MPPSAPPAPAAPVAAAPATVAEPKAAKGPSWFTWSKSRLLNTLRVLNACNGLCLVTVAVVSFIIPVATVCVGGRTAPHVAVAALLLLRAPNA